MVADETNLVPGAVLYYPCLKFISSSVVEDFSLTATVVVVSYLKDLVCPFSRNTFSTLAIGGTHRSPKEKAEGCNGAEKGKYLWEDESG